MNWPRVYTEQETLDLICQGRSIARYGDGEFKVCREGAAKAQPADKRLATMLRTILHDSGDCLVGLPNIYSGTPKLDLWRKHATANVGLLSDAKSYASAFITRPDSAPWIDTPAYWAQLESLWVGQDVTLVRGSSKSLIAEDLVGAKTVTEVICRRQGAFAEYEQILARVGTPTRALLCLGPAATALAVALCAKGVHAIDLGHVGMFLRKHRRGEPMWLSKDDKTPEAA